MSNDYFVFNTEDEFEEEDYFEGEDWATSPTLRATPTECALAHLARTFSSATAPEFGYREFPQNLGKFFFQKIFVRLTYEKPVAFFGK